ncbi:AI-2E family transporter [Phycicoccus sp. BSK3Z-2]|uniref:AI-2E family transporter n=1 Tax=Phycicoccus avicenniae TaxID=2828860 RepID=A0A941DEI5_9MICO|nr:AI-2E family transporter [Phycicoccus avicenniae]MBR7744852.1 AI-2E family transporter [Phycicoccus avicenniae]
MRLRPTRSPRRTRATADPAPADTTLAVTDVPTAWSVPRGVRTASEWAWRGIVIAAALVLVLYAASLLSEVVIPVIVALLLSALLHPVHDRLARFLPTGLAAGITVLGTVAVVTGLLSFVGSQLTSQLGDITTNVTDGIDQIRAWVQDTFGITDTQLADYLDQARQALSQSNLGDSLTAAGLTAGHLVAGFFLALFSLFFFLYDGPHIWGWVVRLFPRNARATAHSSGLIAWGQLAAFTRATIFVAAADAIGIGVGAAILGVPFASGIALLVFFGAFIPIVGATVSGGVAILLALVALGPVQALIMLAIVIGVQQMESHLLQPLLIGRAMRIHPLAVILAIAAGLVLAGIIGGLIAVPTIAVLNAVGHHLLDSPGGIGSRRIHKPTAEDVLGRDVARSAAVQAADDSPDAPLVPDPTPERDGGR